MVRRPASLAHSWEVTPPEARAIQERLRGEVRAADAFDPPRTVAGVDVGFPGGGALTRAAVAVLSFPALEMVESARVERPTRFPYVPGLLSFREVPAVLAALERLSAAPDLILCDGHGYAHPRRFGLACHLGLASGVPTLGVAKKRLIGHHGEVPAERGGWTALVDDGETIGAVLRSRRGVKPIYVSSGHRVGLASAVALTVACLTRYRLPETTRAAHRLASG